MAPEEVDSPSLDAKGIKYVQSFVGALLFYGRAVDNKVLVALNNIGTQWTVSTESTNEAIDHLLDYLSNYPNDDIFYRSRKMVLSAHSDSGLHN